MDKERNLKYAWNKGLKDLETRELKENFIKEVNKELKEMLISEENLEKASETKEFGFYYVGEAFVESFLLENIPVEMTEEEMISEKDNIIEFLYPYYKKEIYEAARKYCSTFANEYIPVKDNVILKQVEKTNNAAWNFLEKFWKW